MYSLLIVNPNSGQDKAAREKRKLLDLVPNMPHIHAVIPACPDEAIELARNAAGRGYDRVLVAGGDGTINLVVNGMLVDAPHATLGSVRVSKVPLRMSRTPGAVRRGPPVLGQHTSEVLGEIGYSCGEIAVLEAGGVVVSHPKAGPAG